MIVRRGTRQRHLILCAVRARCDHPTADQLYDDVRAVEPKISRATVYRNLNCLSDDGVICHVRVPGADRYDLRTDRHYHLFCVRCKRSSMRRLPINPPAMPSCRKNPGLRSCGIGWCLRGVARTVRPKRIPARKRSFRRAVLCRQPEQCRRRPAPRLRKRRRAPGSRQTDPARPLPCCLAAVSFKKCCTALFRSADFI